MEAIADQGFNGLNVGDTCRVIGSTPFKGLQVQIVKLYMAKYVNMKEPKGYATVKFSAGNTWEFQITKLRKENK